MTTRREYFMQNPDEFEKYVWKWRGEKPVVPLDEDCARRDKKYIRRYLCYNMKDCASCPVTRDEYGNCNNDVIDEFLDTLTTADMSDLVPEDREAVQKILDRAAKNAREKKVMFYPGKMADFNVTDAVPPRADGAETTKQAPEMVRPSHYELLPGVNALDVIKVVLNRTCYEPDENFYLGNAIKYILRADEKNGTEDYKKAITYLTWLVESLE